MSDARFSRTVGPWPGPIFTVLIGIALTSAFACGKTTPLGEARSTSAGSAGASDGSGAASDGSAASSDGSGGSESGASDSNTAGASGSQSTDGALPCDLPQPAPIQNPTPELLDAESLIHDYCVTLANDGCLDDLLTATMLIAPQTIGCSIEDRIVSCEQIHLYQYVISHAEYAAYAACEAEWQAGIRCATAAPYDTNTCLNAANGHLGAGCLAEDEALTACLQPFNDSWASITGTRATCSYGPDYYGRAQCEVECMVGPDGFVNGFGVLCGGPDGLPLRCTCSVNGHDLGDDPSTGPLYVSDCQDAAQRTADGWCVNRLDCCFEYVDGTTQKCTCTSDPGLLGATSCDSAAKAYGGTVVSICPQYSMPQNG